MNASIAPGTASPVLEFGLPVPHALRQVESPHLLAEDFRVEERFGFERHLLGDRIRRHSEKTKRNIQHRTTSIQRRKPLHGPSMAGR